MKFTDYPKDLQRIVELTPEARPVELQYDPGDVAFKSEEKTMKTVSDAVEQEGGVWINDDYNAMAWLSGDIDYCSIDDRGRLRHGDIYGPNDPMGSEWQFVCTRAEFEEEVERRKNREEFGTDYHQDDVVFKSAEWSGEGLPPVGTVCEAALEFIDGEAVGNDSVIEVMYVDQSTVVGRIIRGAHSHSFSNGFEVGLYKFRPLQSERDRWIEDTCKKLDDEVAKYNVNIECSAAIRATIEAIYDAGLGRLPQCKN